MPHFNTALDGGGAYLFSHFVPFYCDILIFNCCIVKFERFSIKQFITKNYCEGTVILVILAQNIRTLDVNVKY